MHEGVRHSPVRATASSWTPHQQGAFPRGWQSAQLNVCHLPGRRPVAPAGDRVARSGQILLLQVIFPGEVTPWRLAPLKQVADEPHVGKPRYELATNLTEFLEVKWYGSVTKTRVAFFSRRDAASQLIPGISPIFVRMDDPMLVTTISQAEYLSLAGLRNFAP